MCDELFPLNDTNKFELDSGHLNWQIDNIIERPTCLALEAVEYVSTYVNLWHEAVSLWSYILMKLNIHIACIGQ